MNSERLSRILAEIHDEYGASGKTIDEYLKAKLGASPERSEKEAETAIHTFEAIDTSYAALQKAKAGGTKSADWLKQSLDEILGDV